MKVRYGMALVQDVSFPLNCLYFMMKKIKVAQLISIIDDEEDVYVNGIQFMRTAEKDLIPENLKKEKLSLLRRFTDGEFYTIPEKAIGFFISEDMVKGVTIGKQGYFDIKNETGPTSWRRF